MRSVFFLSGLPRSGSTLLGSILSQNPSVHVTPTSPLYQLLVDANESVNRASVQYTFDNVKVGDRMYRAIVDAAYSDITQPVIFDKHRGWPKNIPAIAAYINSEPRLVCTVRPIAEVVTSYLVLADKDPNNFIDSHLKTLNHAVTNESRAALLWSTYLRAPYENMVHAMREHPSNLLVLDYRDIVYRFKRTVGRIYDFCGLEPFDHATSNIENKCAEMKDEAWGLKDLHTIRPVLGMVSSDPRAYLPMSAIQYLQQFDLPVTR